VGILPPTSIVLLSQALFNGGKYFEHLGKQIFWLQEDGVVFSGAWLWLLPSLSAQDSFICHLP
jgi:hypothetical protein